MMKLGQRFLPALLGLVLGSSGSAAVAAVDAAVTDPWRATGLDFSFIEQRVTTEACYQTETRFLSCMSAAQRLLERGPRRLRLALAADLNADAGSVLQARFGPLFLVEIPSVQRGADLSVAAEVRARGTRISVWRELYRTQSRPDIDFTALREWLLSVIVEPERSEAYAAAAINGYLSIADAHARIMPAKLIHGDRATGTDAAGSDKKYSGIGVALDMIGNLPIVTEVIPGGPAAKAGLRAHDLLLSVDGAAFDGGSLEETLNRVRGPEGTHLNLQFKRGQALYAVRVAREEIAVKNVVSSVIENGESDWGYLAVHNFMAQNTCNEVRRELDSLIAAQVGGLILDVRDNAGGRIDQAVCVADLFLESNLVVLEMRSTGQHRPSHKMHTRFGMRTRLPLVTLVNAGTGSAAEVLAGALRDYGRSLLLGERTFGKGTIQTTRPWDRSGSIMKFSTTARYYLPSGSSVQRVGLEPDLHVSSQPCGKPEQSLVLRLGDLYPTTLPAGSVQSVSRPVPDQVETLACLSSEGGELQSRVEEAGQVSRADYPLYRASEVLSCML